MGRNTGFISDPFAVRRESRDENRTVPQSTCRRFRPSISMRHKFREFLRSETKTTNLPSADTDGSPAVTFFGNQRLPFQSIGSGEPQVGLSHKHHMANPGSRPDNHRRPAAMTCGPVRPGSFQGGSGPDAVVGLDATASNVRASAVRLMCWNKSLIPLVRRRNAPPTLTRQNLAAFRNPRPVSRQGSPIDSANSPLRRAFGCGAIKSLADPPADGISHMDHAFRLELFRLLYVVDALAVGRPLVAIEGIGRVALRDDPHIGRRAEWP